jgi:hypothetical protein
MPQAEAEARYVAAWEAVVVARQATVVDAKEGAHQVSMDVATLVHHQTQGHAVKYASREVISLANAGIALTRAMCLRKGMPALLPHMHLILIGTSTLALQIM